MVADITKISKEFDWKPKIDIDQGLTLTIEKSKEKKRKLWLTTIIQQVHL